MNKDKNVILKSLFFFTVIIIKRDTYNVLILPFTLVHPGRDF